jgi:hypothetical protein
MLCSFGKVLSRIQHIHIDSADLDVNATGLLPLQGTSITSQFSVWYRSLPLVTRYVFTTCVSVQVIAVVVGFDAFGSVCMSPFFFARNFQGMPTMF